MKIKKMLVQFGFALGCVILMAGCSPSPNDAEKALRERIDSESGGQIKLVSFKKTDGQKFEVNGIQGYNMDYEAEIEFEQDGQWLMGGVGMEFKFSKGQPTKGSWSDFLNTTVEGGKNVRHGDHAKIAGVMNGEKKESGWKFEIGESHVTSQMETSPQSAPLQTVRPTDASQTVSAPPPVPFSETNSAVVPTTLQEILTKAQAGDPQAQLNLGLAYVGGRDVDKDMSPAAQWFREEVSQGDNVSAEIISRGVDKDLPQAVQWFRKAADQGNVSAEIYLSVMYRNGWGVDKDDAEAKKWHQKAADQITVDTDAKSAAIAAFKLKQQQLSPPGVPRQMSDAEAAPAPQNVSLAPKENVDFPPEAEQSYRKQFEAHNTGNVMNLVSFRATSGLPFFETNSFNSSVVESYKLNFEVEFEIETDGNWGGVDMHKGDRLKEAGTMIGAKTESGWKFGHPVETHIVNASSPSLFSQLKNAQDVSQQNACINNLRQIDGAINEWALENRKANGATFTMADIKPYIKLNASGEIPSCPAGGTYTLHPVGSNPRVSCSIPSHALQETLTKAAATAEEPRKEAGVVTEVPPSTILGGTSNSLSSLKLIGISSMIDISSKGPQFLALINNHTFAVGDDEEVTTKEGKLNIRVVNITSNSATVEANGQSIELKVSTP